MVFIVQCIDALTIATCLVATLNLAHAIFAFFVTATGMQAGTAMGIIIHDVLAFAIAHHTGCIAATGIVLGLVDT